MDYIADIAYKTTYFYMTLIFYSWNVSAVFEEDIHMPDWIYVIIVLFKVGNRKDNWKKCQEEEIFHKIATLLFPSQHFLLRKMDEKFEFGLKLPATIATFRAGCILQGFLLEPMTKAFEDKPDLENLLSVAWNLKIGTSKLESLK